MSDAGYRFLSLLRRGLSARIPAQSPAGARVAVTTSFTVAGQGVTGLPSLALRGPGDVVGLGDGSVVRTWPAANANNAEPNYFAIAEFRDGDLPWRYTPEATTGDRVTPWLCLIVVEDDEVEPLVPAAQGRPLAILTVNDAGALPDLSQAWAWAHTQILGAPTPPAVDFDAAAVASLLTGAPGSLSSRLVCPRRLAPQTSYLACVLPTFERGRLAGLGQAVDGVDRAKLAWTAGAAPVTLPVYYSWRFQTGQPGDFASLVHLLTARNDLPATVWRRDLAVSAPGVDPPVWQVVGLEGALRTLDAQDAAWSSIDAHGYSAALAKLTNAETPSILGPPLYGRWLAAADKLSLAADATPPWFHQLNADPRARVAAGLGTLVAQAEQEELMAQAWAQVDGIRRINERLRLSQLARELATRLYQRHFAVPRDSLLQLSAPLHAHVRVGATTAYAQIGASPIGEGSLAPAWRRATRPLGSLGVRQGRATLPMLAAANGALARMNTGALSLAPSPTPPPAGTFTRFGDLGATLAKANMQPTKIGTIPIPASFSVGGSFHVPVAAVGLATTTTTAVSSTPTVSSTAISGTTTASRVSLAIAPSAFAQAAAVLMTQLAAPLPAGVQWTSADLDGLAGALAAALHPKQTIEAPLAARLSGVLTAPTRKDPIEPVMAAPSFPQATYAPLAKQSYSWLIPGLDKVPANTVALLANNWPFVESFLVGLNHEMARKLLWNGYPTDQRGTYFRNFWDIRGRADGSTGGDIGPITQWSGALGANRPTATDPLVLLVRGELIRRYPNVVVYAAQAVMQSGQRQPGTTEKQPLFFARLEPDVALFGFDLDPTVARADPGWFFVLAEHPSEPRFGLAAAGSAWGAVPSSWDALGWDHLAASADALAAIRYVDLNASLPLSSATADPTGAVWHASGSPGSRAADLAHITFRRPQRLAIHASVLVPTGATT